MKVKSEHHKVSGSSSAKAHRIRAANLPSHRLSEIQRSEVVRSAGGKLSPIGYSCHRKPASINETVIFFSVPARYSWYSVAWGRRLMFWHPPQRARRRAVRRRHPSSWSRCRSGEVPDRSARCLKKKGGSPAMFHRPALLRSTCTKRVEVSQTPTLVLERRKG